MKAKLIKEAGGYDLYRIDEDNKRVTFASTQDYKQKLSLKNCQSIERGYDLDELAKRHHKLAYIQAYNPEIAPYVEADYKAGFQKALELLGDKKFSEEDVKKIIHWSTLDKDVRLSEEELFKSLQQTEWDVTIVTEEVNIGDKYTPDPKPLLDSEGQLILKRK